MESRLLSLFAISFFLYAAIYSVYSFMFQIVEETGVVDKKRFCLLNLFYIFSFVGMMIFSNIGDRKGIHKYIIAVSILLYSFVFIVLYNLKYVADLYLRNIFVVLNIIAIYILFGGTFPLVDSLTYNYLEHTGSDNRLSGRIRMGGSFGNMFIQIFCSVIQYFSEKDYTPETQKQRKIFINIGCNVVFSVCTALTCLLFAPKYVLGKKNIQKEKKSWNLKKFFTDLFTIFTPIVFLYTMAVIGIGIERAAITGFLGKFLENKGFERSFIHILFFCRTVPEVIIYGFSRKVEKLLGMNVMFFCAIAISGSRTLYYAYSSFNEISTTVKTVTIIAEIFKGVHSSFFNYSSLRIFRSFATDDTLSSAQGLFNSVYNALSYVVFALFGYFLLNYETITSKETDGDLRKLFRSIAFMNILCMAAPIVNILRIRALKRKSNEVKEDLQKFEKAL